MIFHSGDALMRIVMAILFISSSGEQAYLGSGAILSKALIFGMYLQASIWKLRSPSWRNHQAMHDVLSDQQYARNWVLGITRRLDAGSVLNVIQGAPLTFSVILLQLCIAGCVIIPGLEACSFAMILLLHLSIFSTIRLGYLTFVVVLAGSLPVTHASCWFPDYPNAFVFLLSIYLIVGDSRSPWMYWKVWRDPILVMRWLGLGYTWQMFANPDDTPIESDSLVSEELQDAKRQFLSKAASLGWVDTAGQFKNCQSRKFYESMDFSDKETLQGIVAWSHREP
jgi:hypothetical protein